MKTLLTFLALGCLWAQAQSLPPFPSVPTNKLHRLPTNSVKLPSIPPSRGVSYTNLYSLMPPQRWVSGWGRSDPVYLPHNWRHDTNNGAFVLDWASAAGLSYAVEWTDTGIFYPVQTVGGWYGTNRTYYSNVWESTVWPTNKPGYWRVVRL